MKTALGKGLSSLISEKVKYGEILHLDIDSIVPGEYQPRRIFKDEDLEELA